MNNAILSPMTDPSWINLIRASCLRLCRIDLHPPPLVGQHRNSEAGQVINVFAHQLPMRQFPKNLCCCFGKMHCSLLYNHLHFLARLLNVVAYNSPDAPYVPLLHPMAGLLLEAGLNEEEVNTHFKENPEQNRSLI